MATATSTEGSDRRVKQVRVVAPAELKRPALRRQRRAVTELVGTEALVDRREAREKLSLRQVAERSGTSVAVVRRYARRGLMPEARRTPTFGWLFPVRAVERVAMIRAARTLGLSMAQIGVLLRAVEDVSVRDSGGMAAGL